jgi:hypothetical protein
MNLTENQLSARRRHSRNRGSHQQDQLYPVPFSPKVNGTRSLAGQINHELNHAIRAID